MSDETPQTENEAAGGQSRAGEAGANLTTVLGACRGMRASMWMPVTDKKLGRAKQRLLCAWQPSQPGGVWEYEVLVHWPDGVWTDTLENEVEPDEMPDCWTGIDDPTWVAPNDQAQARAEDAEGGCSESPGA